MKYTKFVINNFKGIKFLEIDLNNNPKFSIFTFVGLNESGKSTILEAISFLNSDSIDPKKRHVYIPKSRKENFSDSISVTATLEMDHIDKFQLKQFSTSNGYELINDIDSFNLTKKFVFEDSTYISEELVWDIHLAIKRKGKKKTEVLIPSSLEWKSLTDHILQKLLPPIIHYPNFLFDFPMRIFLKEFEGEGKEQKFYRSVLQDVLDSLDSQLNLEKHILARLEKAELEEQEKEALNSTMLKLSAQITQKVIKGWGELFRTSGSEILVKTGSIQVNDIKKYYVEIKLKIGAEEYQISERSLGFQWFFAFLLFTELRKNRVKDNGEILFLLDEPASNLHSTAQGKLLATFKDITNKSKLIYTTHSHHLINPDWLEGAFIVKNQALSYDKDFEFDNTKTDITAESYKRFVSKSPNQTTYFQPVLDSLDYKPSNLELVPEIIVVEGKYDFYTLKYFNKVIFGSKYQNLFFYPGGGAGKNSQVIKLYLAWGRKFLVLMDSDSAGIGAKEKYLDEIGIILTDKIITLSDIDKKWKKISMEGLFEENEQIDIIQSLDPRAKKYSKKKFNSAIQNLLFFHQKISLSSTTMEKFNAILDFLSTKMKDKQH